MTNIAPTRPDWNGPLYYRIPVPIVTRSRLVRATMPLDVVPIHLFNALFTFENSWYFTCVLQPDQFTGW